MNKIQNFLILTVLILTISACKEEDNPQSTYDGEVRVGILHSRTGSLAISENTVAEAELLAIAEINADGGLLIDGKRMRIITIEEDGMSDRLRFANMAAKLIDIEGGKKVGALVPQQSATWLSDCLRSNHQRSPGPYQCQ